MSLSEPYIDDQVVLGLNNCTHVCMHGVTCMLGMYHAHYYCKFRYLKTQNMDATCAKKVFTIVIITLIKGGLHCRLTLGVG